MAKDSKISSDELSILKITIENDLITAHISDGRIVSIPVAWFPRLHNATEPQLSNFEISPSRHGIHWSDLDEDITIKDFVDILKLKGNSLNRGDGSGGG